VQGTTVAEQLRTFGGKLFRLEAHLERLFRSLAVVEVDCGMPLDELAQVAVDLAAHNHPLLTPGDDLGLAIFVTPGSYAPMSGASSVPTVCLHTFPLSFKLWAHKYAIGDHLATTDVEQVPAGCWPPELKCRSRMHYYLADRQARARFPDGRALLTDSDGFVTETTTANLVVADCECRLLIPPKRKVLPGISLSVLLELADQLQVEHRERDLTPGDLLSAAEVFITSSSVCTLPVTRFNGQPIGAGAPGPMFARFLAAWNELVGLDIAAQARSFSNR
jgi:branched-chain amino acid aminotransferase